MKVTLPRQTRDRAFTWIELIVISSTFAVLMGLFLPAVQQAVR